mmetsp:Transcript_7548/g.19557  ORF Transcript_7548/g.19557 Transcript_7548/m.19557 type:complete len:90 (-) Transcript_7548:1801-2070(-)
MRIGAEKAGVSTSKGGGERRREQRNEVRTCVHVRLNASARLCIFTTLHFDFHFSCTVTNMKQKWALHTAVSKQARDEKARSHIRNGQAG